MKTYTYTEKKDTRSGFGAGLAELGRTNPNVVALCADLIGSLKMNEKSLLLVLLPISQLVEFMIKFVNQLHILVKT